MSDPIIVPVALDTPLFNERVTLDGQEYLLEFDWNDRLGRWFLSIATGSGDWLARGLRLIANWPLTRKVIDHRKPPGILMAIDFSSNSGEPPTLSELGRRVQLVYYPVT